MTPFKLKSSLADIEERLRAVHAILRPMYGHAGQIRRDIGARNAPISEMTLTDSLLHGFETVLTDINVASRLVIQLQEALEAPESGSSCTEPTTEAVDSLAK